MNQWVKGEDLEFQSLGSQFPELLHILEVHHSMFYGTHRGRMTIHSHLLIHSLFMVTFCLYVVRTMAMYILGKIPQLAVTLHITLMLCIPLLGSFSGKIGTQCCVIDTSLSCSISHIPNHFATLLLYLVFLDFTYKCDWLCVVFCAWFTVFSIVIHGVPNDKAY